MRQRVIQALCAAAVVLRTVTGSPVVTSVVDCDPNLTFHTHEVGHQGKQVAKSFSQISGNSIIPERSPVFRETPRQHDCQDLPQIASNSRLTCNTASGSCQATCQANYQFPNGENTMYLSCERGAWKIHGADWSVLPACKPICHGGCLNEGVCVAPNRCACPPDFTGNRCQQRDRQCTSFPRTPMNSRKQCMHRNCTVKCLGGSVFPGGLSEVNFNCRDGQWISNSANISSQNIPDCEFKCDPPCQNRGQCLAYNRCQCPAEYRGLQCQYSTERCAFRNLRFNGGYVCNGTSEFFTCALSCPTGTTFSYPPAPRYTCYYRAGVYAPSSTPQCVINGSSGGQSLQNGLSINNNNQDTSGNTT